MHLSLLMLLIFVTFEININSTCKCLCLLPTLLNRLLAKTTTCDSQTLNSIETNQNKSSGSRFSTNGEYQWEGNSYNKLKTRSTPDMFYIPINVQSEKLMMICWLLWKSYLKWGGKSWLWICTWCLMHYLPMSVVNKTKIIHFLLSFHFMHSPNFTQGHTV